ncbi:hypothetical protein [Leifsonia sp. Root112D2]|uniref:hypothetical protein n=1 Tax=Leifsonia sp. Root112D2 TaxID=1736426 RepID=UPI0006FD01C5|nr:hypothetical protein [Leifsonia sp. Root112D2]KQV07340.1 hypothetical protein ASC63_08555 [Leifsonia sp. Root112D2]
MVTLSNESILKGLSYLKILNESNVYPSVGHVNAFVATPLPQSVLDRQLNSPFAALRDREIAQYLLKTGMAEDEERNDELSLTPVGLAFLRGLEKIESSGTSGESVLEVVGRLEDPITYSKLLTEIDKQPSALVIDPYLPSGDLLTLIELPSVKRVLTRDISIKGQKQEERKRHLAIALGARPEVELRFLPVEIKELHDRYVLPSSGEGLMIGTSLGGSQLTVVTHLGADSTDVLLKHYETLWEQATPLAPIERLKVTEEENAAEVEAPKAKAPKPK